MTWRNFFIGFLLFCGVANTVAFIYSPQPYGIIGFLNFVWAYMVWDTR